MGFRSSGDIEVELGAPGTDSVLTQLSASFAPTGVRQNGAATGTLTGVNIDERGIVEVTYDSGFTRVIDQRSGTIVLGSDVRISRVAVTQGSLTLRVQEEPLAVQPNPFAPNGAPIILPRTEATIEQEAGPGLVLVEESVSLPEVIEGLNALGVSPREMIDILKAIKTAGALHAEFVVQ